MKTFGSILNSTLSQTPVGIDKMMKVARAYLTGFEKLDYEPVSVSVGFNARFNIAKMIAIYHLFGHANAMKELP